MGITSLWEDLEAKLLTPGQLLGYPWKVWGITVQTSYWEGLWHQNCGYTSPILFLEAAREISEKRNLFFVNRSVPENLQLCFNILYLGIPVLFSHHSDMMLSTKIQSRHVRNRCSWRSLACTRIMTKAHSQDGIVGIKCIVSEGPPSAKISINRIKHKLDEKPN